MISSHYGRVLFRELTAAGVAPEELLRGTHLTEDRLWNHPKVDPQDFLALLRNARSQNHNLRLGLLAGGKNRIAGLGIMGVAMMAAPTLGDGLKAMTSYSTVEAGYLWFPVVVGHNQSRIEFVSEVDLDDCLDIHVEAVFSLFQDYIEDLVGAKEQALSFSVTYDGSDYREIYKTLFKGSVRYKQSINAVYFPTAWLKSPPPTRTKPIGYCHSACLVSSSRQPAAPIKAPLRNTLNTRFRRRNPHCLMRTIWPPPCICQQGHSTAGSVRRVRRFGN